MITTTDPAMIQGVQERASSRFVSPENKPPSALLLFLSMRGLYRYWRPGDAGYQDGAGSTFDFQISPNCHRLPADHLRLMPQEHCVPWMIDC